LLFTLDSLVIAGKKVCRSLLPYRRHCGLEVKVLNAKVLIDSKEIDLNEFVDKILSGTVVGAVTSLRGISKDWKTIEIRVTR